jgi:hypothetical protein
VKNQTTSRDVSEGFHVLKMSRTRPGGEQSSASPVLPAEMGGRASPFLEPLSGRYTLLGQ